MSQPPPERALPPPRPGWRHGGFELIERVAEGPFAEVWRGVRRDDDVAVAVKFARTPLGARMLHTERDLALGALFDCCVPLLGATLTADAGYVVRPWLPQGSLRERLNEIHTRDERAWAVRTVLDVASALARVHRRRVVHGDLKPENVLLDAEGKARLIDFGLAQHLVELRRDQSLSASLNTRDNPTGGTLAYMAPEVVKGAIPDTPADVYALGIMLHEALLGRRPSKGKQSDAQLARLPAGVPDVLTRCLAYDPAERYPSAVELADDLRPLRESLVATGARRQLRGLARWLVGGAAAAVVAFRYASVVALLSAYVGLVVLVVQNWERKHSLLIGLSLFGCAALFHAWIGWAGPNDDPNGHRGVSGERAAFGDPDLRRRMARKQARDLQR